MALSAQSCLAANDWLCPEYVSTRKDQLIAAVEQHVVLTVVSVVLGLLIAFPLALLARRNRTLTSLVMTTSTVLYTIPSLALFAVLVPITGLTPQTVVVGLVLYSLTILVRAFVDGLEGVDEEVVEAARGMGYGPSALLFRVRLPLAGPVIFAGLRVATVSTVALVTIGFVVGYGGLGNLINTGLRTVFKAEVLTATVLCVILAVLADLLVLLMERILIRWRRA